MSDPTEKKPAETVSQIFKGENNDPHHMSGLTDSAINPGAVLKANVEMPTDQRFTVKKDFGASQVVSSGKDHESSELIYREEGKESSDVISRTHDTHKDQLVQSGATILSSGVAFAQADGAASSEVVQSHAGDPIKDYAVTEGARPEGEPIPVSEEELREQTLSKVDQMLEDAKRRGEDMEAVMAKAEQMMTRVKSISEAMKVDDTLKERIRQTMLRTHQLRRRVTKPD